MADRIKLLPEVVANQIAAGEVVNRPSSVVKEMMENAIDAGARSVKVNFRDGGKELIQIGDPVNLGRLYKELLNKDWFMTLLDVKEYIQTKERMFADYEDETAWSKKMLVNIAKAGFFSSDRTIAEYNRDIWKL